MFHGDVHTRGSASSYPPAGLHALTDSTSVQIPRTRWQALFTQASPSCVASRTGLWGVTVLGPFAEDGARQKALETFRVFRRSSRSQGLDLLVVQVLFSGQSAAHLEAELHRVSFVERGPLGLGVPKEHFLNLAVDSLPASCTMVAWVDPDLIFASPDWICQAVGAVARGAVVVQPFSFVTDLPPGVHRLDLQTAGFMNALYAVVKVQSSGKPVHKHKPEEGGGEPNSREDSASPAYFLHGNVQH
eukprot:RCo037606